MKEKILYLVWGCLYILCVGLGTIQEATGLMKLSLTVIGIIFFVPGGILLYDALSSGNGKGVLRIRWISIASLTLTMAGLAGFFASGASGSEETVNLAYEILMLVSSPMACSQFWLLSIFLWGCLLSATFLKKKEISSPQIKSPDQR
ncbi:MAG: hypothetical protein J6A74_03235 [Oscillospiraceae bacterium]|nr:hypothetical protein [Oscillospiraceae bacterium]